MTAALPLNFPAVADAERPPPRGLIGRLARSHRIVLGGGIVAAILLICLAALPWCATDNGHALSYNHQYEQTRAAPSPKALHLLFGTDTQGRSLLGRCLLGGAISLAIGAAAAAISVFVGVAVGLLAGYRGGWLDAFLMRIVDILYGLPYILLIILFKVAFESGGSGSDGAPRGPNTVVLLFCAIGLVSWLTMARVVRGQVLSLRSQPFIEAARASGLSETRIFLRHLLPNLLGPIIVYATLIVPQAILQESFLSFLGVGIKAPLPTWGSLASDGLDPALNTLHSEWWMLFFPCALLAVTLLGLNFLGDGLRDVFDPRRDAAKV